MEGRKYKQIYMLTLETSEPYIDRSTEITEVLEENPIFNETSINTDLQSDNQEEIEEEPDDSSKTMPTPNSKEGRY